MLHTRVTELLGIDYPILCGGMIWVSTSPLVAAVSEAGGLGLLAGGSMSPEELASEIDKVRLATKAPFGVNIPLVAPKAEEKLEVCKEKRVGIISTSAGNPARYTRMLKERGCKVIHVVASVAMAKKAESSGVDIIVAEGYEAGGHNGRDELTTMAMVPQVVDAVEIPVVAAGGIADGRGLAAALCLGAEGVQMGSRFVVTKESPVHRKYKERIIAAADTDTVITGRFFNPTRVVKNRLAQEILQWEKEARPPEDILEMIGDNRMKRAAIEGDMEEGSVMIGQVAGMIKEEKSVREVFEELLYDFKEVVKRLTSLVED